MSRILELLHIKASQQSFDYVENKQQFHLFNLLTEQRHPQTWNLSAAVQNDIEHGLRMIVAVDSDIERRLEALAEAPAQLENAAQAIVEAISSGFKIYFYGCGATGRLAKQMESSLWRPFWQRLKRHDAWKKLQSHFPSDIEERCIGEMTGADRALVSSLEGFEDLQLIGRLQLKDRGVQRGDVVFCVTEGGETSSVIGTVLAALDQYRDSTDEIRAEAPKRLYFVYNNPDEVLRPFNRSVSVIDNPSITKINLATGPQAIAGSTRMQATTIETFVMGVVLEEALARLLRQYLSVSELESVGCGGTLDLKTRLLTFADIRAGVDEALPALAKMTAIEAETYRQHRFAVYFAEQALITVFIDNTERSPTFRLPPLDRVPDAKRQSWVQVWTDATDSSDAWLKLLGHPFRGLDGALYRAAFENDIDDPFLKSAALNSLANAGNDEASAYDFSFSLSNIERRGPSHGDLGVAVAIDEELEDLNHPESAFSEFIDLCHRRGAKLALVTCGSVERERLRAISPDDLVVNVLLKTFPDPLTLRRQIALKVLLNAHSTATMAILGRVVGNTMTNVSPSNLKLVGRATFLIQSHVNDVLRRASWAGSERREEITFSEANAVLFEAMDYVRSLDRKHTPEVALSIIRIVESLRRGRFTSWDEAREIIEKQPLATYLATQTGSLTALK